MRFRITRNSVLMKREQNSNTGGKKSVSKGQAGRGESNNRNRLAILNQEKGRGSKMFWGPQKSMFPGAKQGKRHGPKVQGKGGGVGGVELRGETRFVGGGGVDNLYRGGKKGNTRPKKEKRNFVLL